MIVAVSPADYNLEETQTSLYYATRVKLIVNETVKNIETKELSRMKEYLKDVTEERDALKQILAQTGIRLDKAQMASLTETPSKVEDDENKYDEAYQAGFTDNSKI